MSALATIHVGKKALGLDETDYRALLAATTGKASARDMDEAERRRVIARMRELGFKGASNRPKTSRAPHVRLVYALWGDLQKLGAVTRGPAGARALRAFVRRQAKVSAPEFLTAEAARSVIEALKAWIKREKGK